MRPIPCLALLLALQSLDGSASTGAPPCPPPVRPAPNPLLAPWSSPGGLPALDQIRAEHFEPAFTEAMRAHRQEIEAIATSKEPPTFVNTLEALEDSGLLLGQVTNVFNLLTGAETNERLQSLEASLRPRLTAHQDDINLNEALFLRVKAVFDQRERLSLNGEQRMLLERTHRRFVRGGAGLSPSSKLRLRAINGEISSLIVKFNENLLSETNAYRLVLEKPSDLEGLSQEQVLAAAETAKKAGLPGKWVFTLKGPSLWPFLQSARNRDHRRELFTAYTHRCEKGSTDNRAIFARLASLRVEKARMLGHLTWAHYMLDQNMAKTPAGAYSLLDQLWKPALAMARAEAADLQSAIDAEQGGFKLEAWDWRYYAEKVRKARFDLDEAALKPYLSLDRVREGAFLLAGRLYGLTFTERKDLPVYHPEASAFEVKERDGRHIGFLYLDFHPRPGKRSGAWCLALRDPWIQNGKAVSPVVYNVCNFSRPAGAAPALLSPDEAETLFHEFGHALHGLFSNYRYRSSGNVAIDFVELPSQVMENWVFEPEFLKLYARHWKTGEVIPEALVQKLQKAGNFGQGMGYTERLAASYLDMDWHTLGDPAPKDATAFERTSLERRGLLPQIPPRYRTSYFLHAADEYSAGYYSYTWSEILDADAFQAFKEKGDLFHPATAAAFRALLSKGGSEEPAALYRAFRGRDPKADALLDKRNLR